MNEGGFQSRCFTMTHQAPVWLNNYRASCDELPLNLSWTDAYRQCGNKDGFGNGLYGSLGDESGHIEIDGYGGGYKTDCGYDNED